MAIAIVDNTTLWRWIMSHGYRAFVEDLPAGRRREFRDRVMALRVGDRMLRRTAGGLVRLCA